MKINIIGAFNNKLAIGKDNKLLWHVPEDLKFFKKMTLNNPILMGRKTKESLPIYPLPKRKNIVLTRNPRASDEVSNFDDVLKQCKGYETLWIIGGETLYKEFLVVADELYLTSVLDDSDGDVYFPYHEAMELFPHREVLEVHNSCTMIKYTKKKVESFIFNPNY